MIDRLNRWLDRRLAAVLLVLSVALIVALARRAAVTPFWHDEIYTALLSRLPLTGVWSASVEGVDLAPPLNSALTHALQAVTGAGLIATRLPALLGFITAFIVIGMTVRRESNALTGLTASLLFCFTAAYPYAVQARGYGLTTACFAMLLASWLTYASGRGRLLPLGGLALALAAGLWTHYFFVFAVVPIICGEAIRQTRQRRIDFAFWGAIAVAVAAAAPLAWILPNNVGRAATFWTRLQDLDVRATYEFLLDTLNGSRFRVIGAGVVMLLGIEALRRRHQAGARNLPRHTLGAAIACLALPAIAVLTARTLAAGVFSPRYVLFATVGLALVLALVVWRAGPVHARVDVVVCLILAVFFVRMIWRTFEPGRLAYTDPMARHATLRARIDAGAVTVVSAGTRFLELWQVTPPDRRHQLVYLADPESELAETGTDAVDRGYLGLARWSDVGARDAGVFVAGQQEFVLYDAGGFWLRRRLDALGASFETLGRDEGGVLYRVRVAR